MNTQDSLTQNPGLPSKILIVDDDISIRRALSMVLKDFGKVVTAESGRQAIDILGKETFDLILTDYEMQQGNGLELLTFLEASKNKTPAIMITAFGTKDLVMESMKRHVFGFIEKPFNHEGIKKIVQEALGKKVEQDKQERLAELGSISGELVHELSNPITVLDMRVQQIGQSGKTDGIEKASQALNKIKDILTSAKDSIRGENGSPLQNTILQDCLYDAQQEWNARVQGKKIAITLEGKTNYLVQGSRTQIGQIIVNLVNNAIDAVTHHQDQWIKIEIIEEDRHLRVSVTDSGLGISPEMRSKLFEPLFTTKGKSGNGIGLSTVKKIARQCGGDVFFNPDCVNTQFVVILATLG